MGDLRVVDVCSDVCCKGPLAVDLFYAIHKHNKVTPVKTATTVCKGKILVCPDVGSRVGEYDVVGADVGGAVVGAAVGGM